MSRTRLTAFSLAACLLLLPAALGATPFTIETVDGPTNVGGAATSLALDSSGNPHITYHDSPAGDLKYAKKSGAGWITETVDAAGVVGFYSSLALDAQGSPRVAYWDQSNLDLKYASKATGVWVVETCPETSGVTAKSAARTQTRIKGRRFLIPLVLILSLLQTVFGNAQRIPRGFSCRGFT